MFGFGPCHGLGNFPLGDLAVNDFKGVNPDPHLTSIVHHNMKMRWRVIFEINAYGAIIEPFDDGREV